LFDAGACAAAIVTDQVSGLVSVFGDAVRTYRSPAELRRQVDALAAQSGARQALGGKLRQIVLANHTFAHRAEVIWNYIGAQLAVSRVKAAVSAAVSSSP
jgi:spore maturation protein CgeB